MLSVSLTHSFENFSLDVRFAAPSGITVLFGRSGSGKSTIINAIAGLLAPERGHVVVDEWTLLDSAGGVSLPPHRRRLGYIFQEGRLFGHLTVRQNLKYGQWFAPRDAQRESMDRIVDMLGLGNLLDRRPQLLSGGEKQRVAIGRALLASPKIILADEPLAALDEARKAEIIPYFERLRDEISIPIVYVSHSASEVARLATTVVALEGGHVIRQGNAADVLGDPAVLPLGARGAGAMLEGSVVAHHDDGLSELNAGGVTLLVPLVATEPGKKVRVRIAAHDVILSREKPSGLSALNIIPGTVMDIREGDGPGCMVVLDTNAGRILVRITRRSPQAMALAPGVRTHAIIKTVSFAPYDISAR